MLGDAHLDVVVSARWPLAEETDTPARTAVGVGGQAANVAAWVVALGGQARLIAARGTDLAARLVAAELARRGWLTPFQANQLVQGRGQELVVGPYVLIERLGEGGAGLVFKALHRKMQRIVALKFIRRELVRDAC